MKKIFVDRLEAIQWIAEFSRSEGEFEVLREELTFNFIYHHEYFINARHINAVLAK